MTNKINLKWHDIKEDMKNTFESLIETNDFVDVSLVCEDGQLVEAHKVIFFSFYFFAFFLFLFFLGDLGGIKLFLPESAEKKLKTSPPTDLHERSKI